MRKISFFVILMFASLGVAQVCPDGVSEGFEDGPAGWVGAAATTMTVQSGGGNPGGYAELTPSSFNTVMQGAAFPWAGGWASDGVDYLHVDLAFFGGDASNVRIRVRFNAVFSGWWYVFTTVGPSDGGWHHYHVVFDPTWSDIQAEAAGWAFGGGDAVSFAATMASVGYLELWSVTPGSVGVDNFSLGCQQRIFADGFESSDTTKWSNFAP